MKLGKLNRVTHRDIGYLITGLTLIYAISGIAINHNHDWNPNYIISQYQISTDIPFTKTGTTEEMVLLYLDEIGEKENFKKFYFPSDNLMTIFLKGGSAHINLSTRNGYLEKIKKKPFFYEINFLHYNPGKWWKYFSDIYCVALILVTITGLFIVKGRNGITRRGAWLTIIGIILPLIFLFIY